VYIATPHPWRLQHWILLKNPPPKEHPLSLFPNLKITGVSVEVFKSGTNSTFARGTKSTPDKNLKRKSSFLRIKTFKCLNLSQPLLFDAAHLQPPSLGQQSIFRGKMSTADLRESLSWIRMTRTARQDARRSGKEDAEHSLFLEECLFGFYGEHTSKIRKGSCRDVT